MGCGSSSTEKQQNQATTSDHQIALDRVSKILSCKTKLWFQLSCKSIRKLHCK